MNKQPGMSLIVRTVACWLKPFILLFGAYIVLYGHLTPGGGFSGGVVIACALVLLTLALGQKTALTAVSKETASALDSLGALLFLGVAVSGLCATGLFFENYIATPEASFFKLLSSGTIPISNVALGFKVSMSLFLAFTVLSALHVTVTDGGERKMRKRGNEE